MARKPKTAARFLDAEETDRNFASLLFGPEADGRRESAIQRIAQAWDIDHRLPEVREVMLGLLAWCISPDYVKRTNKRTGAAPKWTQDRVQKISAYLSELKAGGISNRRAAGLLKERFRDEHFPSAETLRQRLGKLDIKY